jgi:tRNA (guanine-N7-)-methyltransferase
LRKKLIRFNENANRFNIIQPADPRASSIKGNWHNSIFKNDNPIVLELACGKGEYTTGLAKVYPDKNFIGVDIKGSRIWYGSTYAMENNLKNVAFLRSLIHHLDVFFNPGEVSEIWITFPDPRPKTGDAKRRLTHPRFLELYRKVLVKGGLVHLKTDNTPLFEFSLETLEKYPTVSDLIFTHDLYQSPMNEEHFGIKTYYEAKFHAEGENIKYLKFRLN